MKAQKWQSTSEALRRRKSIELTLSPEALRDLAKLAAASGISRSRYVELLLLAAALDAALGGKRK